MRCETMTWGTHRPLYSTPRAHVVQCDKVAVSGRGIWRICRDDNLRSMVGYGRRASKMLQHRDKPIGRCRCKHNPRPHKIPLRVERNCWRECISRNHMPPAMRARMRFVRARRVMYSVERCERVAASSKISGRSLGAAYGAATTASMMPPFGWSVSDAVTAVNPD